VISDVMIHVATVRQGCQLSRIERILTLSPHSDFSCWYVKPETEEFIYRSICWGTRLRL